MGNLGSSLKSPNTSPKGESGLRGSSESSDSEEEEFKVDSERRFKTIEELITSEQTYLDKLRDTIEYWMKPLSREYFDEELPKEMEDLKKRIKDGLEESASDERLIGEEVKYDDEEKKSEEEEEESEQQGKQHQHPSIDDLTAQLESLKEKQKVYKHTSRILSEPDFKTIFEQIPMLYGLNQEFYGELKSRWLGFDNDITKIGDIFLQYAHFFKLYQLYFNKQGRCISLLSSSFFLKSKKYADFTQSVREAGMKKQTGVLDGTETLGSLLMLPARRIPRYATLLSEIVKHTDKMHPDLRDLKKSLKLIKQTVIVLDQRIEEFQRQQRVKDIDSQFDSSTIRAPKPIAIEDDVYKDLITDGTFVKPHRFVIKEGSMTKFEQSGRMEEFHFILFNDILVYASRSTALIGTAKLKLKQVVPFGPGFFVQKCTFPDSSSKAAESAEGETGGMGAAVSVVSESESEARLLREELMDRGMEIWSSLQSFMVLCDDPSMRDEWLSLLKQTARNNVDLFQTQVRAMDSARKAGVPSSKLMASVIVADASLSLDIAEPLMIPDTLLIECMAKGCSKKFSTFVRVHHCRSCGKGICSDCGKHSMPHRRIPSKMVKPVCDACFEAFDSHRRHFTK